MLQYSRTVNIDAIVHNNEKPGDKKTHEKANSNPVVSDSCPVLYMTYSGV